MHTNNYANLRISYIGGGFDYPPYFKQQAMRIIAEGIPLRVTCAMNDTTIKWHVPLPDIKGLGTSGARWLSLTRTLAPDAPEDIHILNAIRLEALNGGGWQDVIAASQQGLMRIVLQGPTFHKIELEKPTTFDAHRCLYKIPYTHQIRILNQQQRPLRHLDKIPKLVVTAERAIKKEDYAQFGKAITAGWELKKTWHPAITNPHIEAMETHAERLGAFGYKVCGAGGQGTFLVIAEPHIHQQLAENWEPILLDR